MNNTVVLIMPEHFLQSVSPLLSLYLPEFKIETISSDVELDAISDILYHADFLLFTGTTILLQREVRQGIAGTSCCLGGRPG